MESSPAPPSPVLTALHSLSPRQRVGLVVLGVAFIGLLAWRQTQSSSERVALFAEHGLSVEESHEIAGKLREAGLTDFHESEDQIFVPVTQIAEYRRISANAPTKSGDWATEWERQNERLNPFSGSHARETSREIARARHAAAMLRQLPDIEQADVVWDEDSQTGWRQQPRCRATVYLQPVAGRELSLEVIRAVRLAVAGSKKHLDPADVTIMDLARQVTYDGSEASLVGEHLLPQLRVLADVYRQQISHSLQNLDGADVLVDVDFPRFFDFLNQSQASRAKTLASAAPQLLRVTIEVPSSTGASLGTDSDRATFETALQQQLVTLLNGSRRTEDAAGFQSSQITILLPAVEPIAPIAPQHAVLALMASIQTPLLSGLAVIFGLIGVTLLFSRSGSSRKSVRPETSDRSITALDEFDDITRLDQETTASLYTQISPTSWAIALRGASDDVARHVIASLASPSATELRRHCEDVGPVRLGDVQFSQNRILAALHQTQSHSS